MQRAVQVVWWIGLIGALVGTLVVLKEVALVLRALRNINELAEITRDAACGIAANLEAIARLETVGGPLGELRAGAGSVAVTAASLKQKLDAVAPASAPRGGG